MLKGWIEFKLRISKRQTSADLRKKLLMVRVP